MATFSNEYKPNELVVADLLFPCESVKVTTAFRRFIPLGVLTAPETVATAVAHVVSKITSSIRKLSLPDVPAGRL